jgi:hypothetical protein
MKVDNDTFKRILYKQTMQRIKEETKKDITKRLRRGSDYYNFIGRVVIGSSLSKKILEKDSNDALNKKSQSEIKNGIFETLYPEESIKSKSRFKHLLHQSQISQHTHFEKPFTVPESLLHDELIGTPHILLVKLSLYHRYGI